MDKKIISGTFICDTEPIATIEFEGNTIGEIASNMTNSLKEFFPDSSSFYISPKFGSKTNAEDLANIMVNNAFDADYDLPCDAVNIRKGFHALRGPAFFVTIRPTEEYRNNFKEAGYFVLPKPELIN